jgi:hypothetical protein
MSQQNSLDVQLKPTEKIPNVDDAATSEKKGHNSGFKVFLVDPEIFLGFNQAFESIIKFDQSSF